MRLFREIALTIMIMVFTVLLAGADDKTPSPVQVELFNLFMKQALVGHVSVDGVVQDLSGVALSNVTVTITKGTYKVGIVTNKTLVSGKFHFDLGQCSWIRMDFEKDGYDFSRYDTGYKGKPDKNPTVAGSYAETNVVIVLNRKGELTYFHQYDDTLSYDEGEKAKWGVTEFTATGPTFAKLIDSPTTTICNATNYLYLAFNTNVAGRVFLGTNGLPPNLQIVMTGTNGCFIDLGSTSELIGKNKRSKLDTMKDAPTSGYTNMIVLDQAKKQHYFYFRVNYGACQTMYGKGCLDSPRASVWGTNTLVEVPIELNIQPNGTRNLRCKWD